MDLLNTNLEPYSYDQTQDVKRDILNSDELEGIWEENVIILIFV
jgi:hypothetical protein